MKPKIAYIDRTAFDHELGATDVTLHPSKADLISAQPCVHECGYYKVEVRIYKPKTKGEEEKA